MINYVYNVRNVENYLSRFPTKTVYIDYVVSGIVSITWSVELFNIEH